MATGAAKYIATGRSYASMTSSFVDLYQRYAMGRVSDREPHTRAARHHSLCSSLHYRYARSHFFFAFELIVLCVAYRLYTHQPGYFLLYTWPVWLVALAILLSPWAFNPKSFEGLSVRTHFHEFLVWLDSERADSKTSWPEWHAAALSAQRRQSTGRRLQRVALSLIPKAIAFAGATAALRVDRFGHASFRSLLAFVYAARPSASRPALPPHTCSADDNTSSLIRPTHGDKL